MNRRKLLATTVGVAGVAAVGVVGISQATTGPNAGRGGTTAEPVEGAGLFDVDPAQGDLSQDPRVAVVGDVDAMPEDVEF